MVVYLFINSQDEEATLEQLSTISWLGNQDKKGKSLIWSHKTSGGRTSIKTQLS